MVKVMTDGGEKEYAAGVSIGQEGGNLIVYGAAPEKAIIAMHQNWEHAEVVVDNVDDSN